MMNRNIHMETYDNALFDFEFEWKYVLLISKYSCLIFDFYLTMNEVTMIGINELEKNKNA